MPGPTILETMGHQGTASSTVHDNGTETYWFNDGTIGTYGPDGLIESTAVEKIGLGGFVGPDHTVTRNAAGEIINVQDAPRPKEAIQDNPSPPNNGTTEIRTSGGITNVGASGISAGWSAADGTQFSGRTHDWTPLRWIIGIGVVIVFSIYIGTQTQQIDPTPTRVPAIQNLPIVSEPAISSRLGCAEASSPASRDVILEPYNGALRAGNYAQAAQAVTAEVMRNCGAAQVALGALHVHGFGVKLDYAQAAALFQNAADQHDAIGQCKLSIMYFWGIGVHRDAQKSSALSKIAMPELTSAAERGDADAQECLAELYWSGITVPRNFSTAAMWFEKASKQARAWAQTYLGYMHTNGFGVRRDPGEAASLYRAAAERGEMTAQYDLALAFQNGSGAPRDLLTANALFMRALPSLTSASQQGDFRAQTLLGFAYALGYGVPRNEAAASSWLNKTTEFLYVLGKTGDPWAQTSLGYMYSRGLGVSQNNASAAAWLRYPAELGSVDAQKLLGYVYQTGGSGLQQDIGSAVFWYQKAAVQGDTYSAERLREMTGIRR
jgi:TPR repeat protein